VGQYRGSRAASVRSGVSLGKGQADCASLVPAGVECGGQLRWATCLGFGGIFVLEIRDHDLAQINIARFRLPMADPVNADFIANLDRDR
jgi:hypothetical protein